MREMIEGLGAAFGAYLLMTFIIPINGILALIASMPVIGLLTWLNAPTSYWLSDTGLALVLLPMSVCTFIWLNWYLGRF